MTTWKLLATVSTVNNNVMTTGVVAAIAANKHLKIEGYSRV